MTSKGEYVRHVLDSSNNEEPVSCKADAQSHTFYGAFTAFLSSNVKETVQIQQKADVAGQIYKDRDNVNEKAKNGRDLTGTTDDCESADVFTKDVYQNKTRVSCAGQPFTTAGRQLQRAVVSNSDRVQSGYKCVPGNSYFPVHNVDIGNLAGIPTNLNAANTCNRFNQPPMKSYPMRKACIDGTSLLPQRQRIFQMFCDDERSGKSFESGREITAEEILRQSIKNLNERKLKEKLKDDLSKVQFENGGKSKDKCRRSELHRSCRTSRSSCLDKIVENDCHSKSPMKHALFFGSGTNSTSLSSPVRCVQKFKCRPFSVVVERLSARKIERLQESLRRRSGSSKGTHGALNTTSTMQLPGLKNLDMIKRSLDESSGIDKSQSLDRNEKLNNGTIDAKVFDVKNATRLSNLSDSSLIGCRTIPSIYSTRPTTNTSSENYLSDKEINSNNSLTSLTCLNNASTNLVTNSFENDKTFLTSVISRSSTTSTANYSVNPLQNTVMQSQSNRSVENSTSDAFNSYESEHISASNLLPKTSVTADDDEYDNGRASISTKRSFVQNLVPSSMESTEMLDKELSEHRKIDCELLNDDQNFNETVVEKSNDSRKSKSSKKISRQSSSVESVVEISDNSTTRSKKDKKSRPKKETNKTKRKRDTEGCDPQAPKISSKSAEKKKTKKKTDPIGENSCTDALASPSETITISMKSNSEGCVHPKKAKKRKVECVLSFPGMWAEDCYYETIPYVPNFMTHPCSILSTAAAADTPAAKWKKMSDLEERWLDNYSNLTYVMNLASCSRLIGQQLSRKQFCSALNDYDWCRMLADDCNWSADEAVRPIADALDAASSSPAENEKATLSARDDDLEVLLSSGAKQSLSDDQLPPGSRISKQPSPVRQISPVLVTRQLPVTKQISAVSKQPSSAKQIAGMKHLCPSATKLSSDDMKSVDKTHSFSSSEGTNQLKRKLCRVGKKSQMQMQQANMNAPNILSKHNEAMDEGISATKIMEGMDSGNGTTKVSDAVNSKTNATRASEPINNGTNAVKSSEATNSGTCAGRNTEAADQGTSTIKGTIPTKGTCVTRISKATNNRIVVAKTSEAVDRGTSATTNSETVCKLENADRFPTETVPAFNSVNEELNRTDKNLSVGKIKGTRHELDDDDLKGINKSADVSSDCDAPSGEKLKNTSVCHEMSGKMGPKSDDGRPRKMCESKMSDNALEVKTKESMKITVSEKEKSAVSHPGSVLLIGHDDKKIDGSSGPRASFVDPSRSMTEMNRDASSSTSSSSSSAFASSSVTSAASLISIETISRNVCTSRLECTVVAGSALAELTPCGLSSSVVVVGEPSDRGNCVVVGFDDSRSCDSSSTIDRRSGSYENMTFVVNATKPERRESQPTKEQRNDNDDFLFAGNHKPFDRRSRVVSNHEETENHAALERDQNRVDVLNENDVEVDLFEPDSCKRVLLGRDRLSSSPQLSYDVDDWRLNSDALSSSYMTPPPFGVGQSSVVDCNSDISSWLAASMGLYTCQCGAAFSDSWSCQQHQSKCSAISSMISGKTFANSYHRNF